MAGVGIDFEANLYDGEVQRWLQSAKARLKDLRPCFKAISLYMYSRIGRVFRDEGYPIPWQPLSPTTIARRRHRRGRVPNVVIQGGVGSGQVMGPGMVGTKILQDTGRLRASITAARGTKDSILQMTPSAMALGTRVEYASTHQLGRGPVAGVTVQVGKHWRGGRKGLKGHWVKAHSRKTSLPAVPARPFLEWLPEDIRFVVHAVRDSVLYGRVGGYWNP